MAKEYIEREAALTELEDIGSYDDEPIQTRNSALKIIQNIPAADVVPVQHGRWISMSEFAQLWECSVCRKHTRRNAPAYCPNCGAKMDGEGQHDRQTGN